MYTENKSLVEFGNSVFDQVHLEPWGIIPSDIFSCQKSLLPQTRYVQKRNRGRRLLLVAAHCLDPSEIKQSPLEPRVVSV